MWLQRGNGSDGEEEGKEDRRKMGGVVKKSCLRGKKDKRGTVNKKVGERRGVNGCIDPPHPFLHLYPS